MTKNKEKINILEILDPTHELFHSRFLASLMDENSSIPIGIKQEFLKEFINLLDFEEFEPNIKNISVDEEITIKKRRFDIILSNNDCNVYIENKVKPSAIREWQIKSELKIIKEIKNPKNKRLVLIVPDYPEENVQKYCCDNDIDIILWDKILEIIEILCKNEKIEEFEKYILQQYCDYLGNLIKKETGGFEMSYDKKKDKKISEKKVADLCKYLFEASKIYNDVGEVFKKIQNEIKRIKIKIGVYGKKYIGTKEIWYDKDYYKKNKEKRSGTNISGVNFFKKNNWNYCYYYCFGISDEYKLLLFIGKSSKDDFIEKINKKTKKQLNELFKFKYLMGEPIKEKKSYDFWYYTKISSEELNHPEELVKEIKHCLEGMYKILN